MCVLWVILCSNEGLIFYMATRLGNSLPIQCHEHQHHISLLRALLFLQQYEAIDLQNGYSPAINGSCRVFTDLIILFFGKPLSNQIVQTKLCIKNFVFSIKELPIALSMGWVDLNIRVLEILLNNEIFFTLEC